MGDGTNPLDPTQTHKHALHLIDGDALQSAFDSATKAEHDRKQGDKAARDKSAAFFTSTPRRASSVAVVPPTSDAQTPPPLPSTLSSDDAHALMAELNQKLALHGVRLPPAPTPPAPPAPPSSEQLLALRIEAEQQLQNGMRSGSWSPAERSAHEAQLAAMKHEADETSPDPEVRKSALYEDLATLGAAQACRSLDTVDSLTARRDAILGAHDTKERGDEEQRINMGLDGKTGTPEQLALYEAQQRYQTYPTTGTGVLLVGIASARGASTEELRAAGARGDMVEGLGGGVGHLVENARARPERELDSTARPVAGRLPHEGNSPKPQVNGRTLMNWRSAFKSLPLSPALAAKYPVGVRFKANGFPDFSPYARATVRLQGLTGKNGIDAPRAYAAAKIRGPLKDFTWHHVEDGETMQLVPLDLHYAARHTGGNAVINARPKEDD